MAEPTPIKWPTQVKAQATEEQNGTLWWYGTNAVINGIIQYVTLDRYRGENNHRQVSPIDVTSSCRISGNFAQCWVSSETSIVLFLEPDHPKFSCPIIALYETRSHYVFFCPRQERKAFSRQPAEGAFRNTRRPPAAAGRLSPRR